VTTTHHGTPLADAHDVPLTPDELAAIPDSIARVTVTHTDGAWRWADPSGLVRHLPDSWALPRPHGEHPVRYWHGRDGSRGLVVLLPPADA
jgi:hypothetical protein